MAHRKTFKIPGTVVHHDVIGPDKRARFGDKQAVNQTMRGLQDQVGAMLNRRRGHPVKVHLYVSIEALGLDHAPTDSAGEPFVTRDADDEVSP